MARPNLEVAPVKNTSFTSFGISLRITAAVKVLPWTTRTLRSGCLLTNNVPPPFKASFCTNKTNPFSNLTQKLKKFQPFWDFALTQTLFRAAKLITLTPSLSALRIAVSIWLLMPCLANGKKYCKKKKNTIKHSVFSVFKGRNEQKKKRERHYVEAKSWNGPSLAKMVPERIEGEKKCLWPNPHA